MLDTCIVRCALTVTEEKDGVNYTVEKGKVYEVRAHPISKSSWFVVFPENQWVLFNKWVFEHGVSQYALHRSFGYGNVQLPVLNNEGLSLCVLSPTGYATMVSKQDVEIHSYPSQWHFDSSEVRFR